MVSCAACEAELAGAQVHACAACRQAFYCSRECQVAHWKAHKRPCKSLRSSAAAEADQAESAAAEAKQPDPQPECAPEKAEAEADLPTVLASGEPNDDTALAVQAIDLMRRRGFAVVDGVFSEAACAELYGDIARLTAAGRLSARASRVGDGTDAEAAVAGVRGDHVCWLVPGQYEAEAPAAARAVHRLWALGAALSGVLSTLRLGAGHHNLQLAPLSSGAMLTCYPGEGTRYVKHIDNPGDSPEDGRKVTALLYLNRNWEPAHGGALRVHLKGGRTVDVPPIEGRVILFWSAKVVHEVLPAYRRRYALSQWFVGTSS